MEHGDESIQFVIFVLRFFRLSEPQIEHKRNDPLDSGANPCKLDTFDVKINLAFQWSLTKKNKALHLLFFILLLVIKTAFRNGALINLQLAIITLQVDLTYRLMEYLEINCG